MSAAAFAGYAAAAGVAATLVMDLSNLILMPLGVKGLTPATFGKWLDALRAGRLVSENLAAAEPSRLPMAVGLAIHYGIGIGLAGGFVFALSHVPALLARPLWAGLVYGVATSVFAWFLMFPSMGYGLFGLRPPEDTMLFASSLARHAAYGLGLGVVARLWLADRLAL